MKQIAIARRSPAATLVSLLVSALVPVSALLATVADATPAFAQDTQAPAPKKPAKKKKPKPAPADAPPEEAPPPTAPAAAPEPAPAEPTPAPAPAPPPEAAPPTDALPPITDVFEKAAKTYYFIGLRYRMTVIPQFLMNLFVDDGTTFISHSFGAELDIRRDDFSIIPSVTYTTLGFGDTLFHQKGQADVAQNYSDVSSGLNAIFVSADILWSKPISRHFSFEYGAGLGIGAIFGSLTNDWVYIKQDGTGSLVGSNGHNYTPCAHTTDDPACTPALHSNSNVSKGRRLPGAELAPGRLDPGRLPADLPPDPRPPVQADQGNGGSPPDRLLPHGPLLLAQRRLRLREPRARGAAEDGGQAVRPLTRHTGTGAPPLCQNRPRWK